MNEGTVDVIKPLEKKEVNSLPTPFEALKQLRGEDGNPAVQVEFMLMNQFIATNGLGEKRLTDSSEDKELAALFHKYVFGGQRVDRVWLNSLIGMVDLGKDIGVIDLTKEKTIIARRAAVIDGEQRIDYVIANWESLHRENG